jgi:leucyl/phenylalanyl-tRNA--protein transferase
VLFPEELRTPRSLERVIRAGRFNVTFNRDFRAVMEGCRDTARPGQDGTWIAPEMIESYGQLHADGHALSVEVWRDGTLVGGLYGVRLGRMFAGESMFAWAADASKVGFVALVTKLRTEGCGLIDCQVYSDHLARFGARAIPRREFLRLLAGVVG